MASSQERSIGGTARQEVKAGQGKQENPGKRKDSVCSCHLDIEDTDENASLMKGTKTHG